MPSRGDDGHGRVQIDYSLLAALQEREQELAEAQRLAGIGSWSWFPTTGELRWSDQLYRIFGLRPGDARVDYEYYLSSILDPGRAAMEDTIARALDDQQPYVVRHCIRRADGAARWIVGHGAVEADGGGNVLRLHGTAQDVTEAVEAQRALEESERRFRTIFEHAGDAVLVLDGDGRVRFASPSVERLIGERPPDSGRWRVLQWVHPDDRDRIRAAYRAAADGGGVGAVTFRFTPSDGQLRHLESVFVDLRSESTVAGFVVHTRDVGERVELERSLRSQRDFLEATLDALDEPVVAMNTDRTIAFSNRAAEEQFVGLERDDVRRQSAETRVAPYRFLLADGTPLGVEELPLIRALAGDVTRDLDVQVGVSDGGHRHFIMNAAPVRDSEDEIVGGVVAARDVTELRWAELMLAHDRTHDPLTGLANRRLFTDSTSQALERAKRNGWTTAVLALDIDHFRDVNDRFGHDVGDTVLTLVAEALEGAFRTSDLQGRGAGTVARLAGDEFFLLCENTGAVENIASLARRAEEAATGVSPPDMDGHRLTVSIGIAVAEPGVTEPEAPILDAESAMREAKAEGGDRHQLFSTSMREAVHHRITLEHELSHAIDGDQLRLVYQPKFSLVTDQISGVEALVRWHHPDRGIVSPLDFIPVAESSGLIVGIGEWVLRESVRQAGRWRDAFPDRAPTQVCVNVSTRQFTDGLVDRVATVLREEQVDPALLALEVTESVALRDIDSAIETMAAFRDLGVSVSIDDFGTGYSSLTYLRRLPLDTLKVDKSFVDGLPDDPESVAIVAATIGMAHALGLDVVAEGVETAEQLVRLRALGCEYAQGYHLGRPMPAEELSGLLAEDHATSVDGTPISPNASVLVVDDAAEIRQFVRVSLETAGYTVTTAASGEEGLAVARQLLPSCVLVDMNMEGMSGVDVCSELRSHPLTRDCTVILLTADAEKRTKLAAFEAGVDDYIIKPFSPRDLVSRLRSAVRRRAETP